MIFQNFTVLGHKLNRERFYIDPLGTLDFIFCKKKPQKWTFQKVYILLEKFFIEIDKKFPKIQLILKSWKKKAFFFQDLQALG